MCDVRNDVAACLVIPPVQGFALGDWEATERSMKEGVRLDFRQPWFASEETDFQPGHVWLGIHANELVSYAVLRDDQPSNRATTLNEPTWQLGDALELFFQADGRPGYHEFHVTPENQRLQLFLPSRAAFLEHRIYRTWAISESCFESATRINSDRTQWEAVMRVDLARVLDEPRDDGVRRFKFSFSRYDYQPGRKHPVTSATTPLSAPNFHKISQWTRAEAARG